MGIQLIHWFTRLFVGFRFVLLSLSLCGNQSTKQMKKEWPEYSHKSSYYTCSLRVSFHGGLFRVLRLIKLPTISLKKNIFICCSSRRSVCLFYRWKLCQLKVIKNITDENYDRLKPMTHENFSQKFLMELLHWGQE